MNLETFLASELESLQTQRLLRSEPDSHAPQPLEVASNDYLGLARQRVRPTALRPLGAGASRLLASEDADHRNLERALAAWQERPASLIFSSGFAANTGLIQALGGPGLEVFSDSLNHASIVDGCRLAKLAGAKVSLYPHLDLNALGAALSGSDREHRLVVTESYFSMDADSPDLAKLHQLCRASGAWLVVDEAHALGVFGAEGRGLCSVSGVAPDALVGTFGKAFGAHGAFVCGSATLRAFLWNRARSFVFSTAPSPVLCALLQERLSEVRAADAARAHLHELSRNLETRLSDAGVQLPLGRHGPIFPILLGDAARALAASEALGRRGFRAPAIRPPTVPTGQARLRVALSAALTPETVGQLAEALIAVCAS